MRAGVKIPARCCGRAATTMHSNVRIGSSEEFLEGVRGRRYRSEKLKIFAESGSVKRRYTDQISRTSLNHCGCT